MRVRLLPGTAGQRGEERGPAYSLRRGINWLDCCPRPGFPYLRKESQGLAISATVSDEGAFFSF